VAEDHNRLKSMAPGEAKLIRRTRRLDSLGICICKHGGAGVHQDACPKSYISKGIALAQLEREEQKHAVLAKAALVAADKVAQERRERRETAWESREAASFHCEFAFLLGCVFFLTQ
jgi:hypothetical protein